MFQRPLGKSLFPAVAVCLVLAACARAHDELATLLPTVDPQVVALLARPDGPDLPRWAADGSADRLIDLRETLLDALYAPAAPTAEGRALLTPALDAVDRILLDTCGLSCYAAESRLLAELPPDSAVAAVTRHRRLQAVFADPAIAAGPKRAIITTLQAQLLAAGCVRGAAEGWYDLAVLNQREGDDPNWTRMHRSSLALARRHDCLPQACRAWGQLMMINMKQGWSAAERDTLHRMLSQTRSARLAAASTFLLSLQAYDATNRGRYATARVLFEDGIAVCRELGDPAKALPTVDLLLRVYAVFECWNQVDQLLVRAQQMQAELEETPGPFAGQRLSQVRHASMAARSLAARGLTDQAHAAFGRAFADAVQLPYAEAEYLGQHWFTAMMESGRADLAAEALASVEAIAQPRGPVLLRLPLWQAWLDWQRGDLAAAEAGLERFEVAALGQSPLLLANLGFQHDALQARIVAPRDPAGAAAILTAGWSDLFRHIHGREADSEAYLDLARNFHLRTAAQDLLGDDPEVGYGLELLWRGTFLPRWPVPTDPAEPGLVPAARALACEARRGLGAWDAVHCLYQVQRGRVVRWTANADGCRCDLLPASPERLRTMVTGILARLGRDPGDLEAPVPPDLAAELAALAREILPPALFDPATRPRALFVSGDSFLAQVPFSPLNLDAGGGYLPLVQVMDVAWLRGGPAAARPSLPASACGEALVVADPALDPGTRRRFGLPAGLPGAATELMTISSSLPAAKVLSGDRATRPAVVATWEDANVLYFVGHAVRDAEVPFSAWLPLAAADAHDPYPGLDLQDVLAAHLDRCRLVVLSGCATGAPYVDGLSSTPSLGDAFLDAGAGAVIQTFWRVRDNGSAFEPQRILAAWQDGEPDLAAAVSAERRRALQGADGIRHPFDWAAWTLKSPWF